MVVVSFLKMILFSNFDMLVLGRKFSRCLQPRITKLWQWNFHFLMIVWTRQYLNLNSSTKLTIRIGYGNLCWWPSSSCIFPQLHTNPLLIWARHFVGLIFNFFGHCVGSCQSSATFFFSVLFNDWENRVFVTTQKMIESWNKLDFMYTIFGTEIYSDSGTCACISWVIVSVWVSVKHERGFLTVFSRIVVRVVVVNKYCLDRDIVT